MDEISLLADYITFNEALMEVTIDPSGMTADIIGTYELTFTITDSTENSLSSLAFKIIISNFLPKK